MIQARGYAALGSSQALRPYAFERKEVDARQVLIRILYCGICHADIHQARNEYGNTHYPLVPGHEIVGRIERVGPLVTQFNAGDLVGVGYFIDSCRHCSSCAEGEEQFCETGLLPTQNGKLPDGSTTKGGYSDVIVVDERYVLHISERLDAPAVAPLLCAGITAYSALTHGPVGPGDQVAILGLGGIGHLAVKFAVAFGAQVTVLSSSPQKQEPALALGAHAFIHTGDKTAMKQANRRFDFILDTVSANHAYDPYLNLLKKDGTLIVVGRPPQTPQLDPISLISRRRKIVGSFIGGMAETQEMLDYCADHAITADIELIPPVDMNKAYERVLNGDVHYRFVIDMAQLTQ
ncbi:NAD(P)-dependent alcohol dehydrogenase [Spirosoma linguale]|uniref:Alcohol dehydrogenase zinc-binding domain protein n=1 Tax=Spirosoma linguale (strain ATCC 33905 / DSM 74 / LMG 10896 / Claus 1) TaxID=504472 RepID=D2QC39_SPILD|nr:Alcohol dehydrogenase zinc-binding domain protein [Spirosoma linguale DSM 74]